MPGWARPAPLADPDSKDRPAVHSGSIMLLGGKRTSPRSHSAPNRSSVLPAASDGQSHRELRKARV